MENFTTDSGTPSKLMADFQAEYGRHWLTGALMPFYTLDDTTLLAFIYVSTETGWTPRKFACTLVCLESKDWGRSWAVRSVPGPWDPALEEKIVARSRSTGCAQPDSPARNGVNEIVEQIYRVRLIWV
jgi:hypothetical protein